MTRGRETTFPKSYETTEKDKTSDLSSVRKCSLQGLDTRLSFAPCKPNLANAIWAAFSRLQPSSHLQSPSILNPHNMSKQGKDHELSFAD